MVQVLFTTPVLKHPPTGGPHLRIENSIKALNKTSELHVTSRVPLYDIGGIDAQKFYENHCNNFLYAPSADNSSSSRYASNKYIRILQAIREKLLNQDAEFILQYAKQNYIDVIWCGFGNISFDLIRKIKKEQSDIKIVCDTDSVWSRFILRELPYEKTLTRKFKIYRAGKKKEKEEQRLVDLADITTAVSTVDAEYYQSLAKDPERVKLFSNVIDLCNYSTIYEPPSNFKRPCIYLAGTFWPKSPMDRAARWIIQDVLPIVKTAIPDVHLYIVGSGSDQTLSDTNNPDITITGMLPTVLPYLCNANVSIVPLKFESGTRFKILEAGACGVPVISTTLGAEGIPVTHGKDILLADSPLDFANSIIRVIQDKYSSSKMAENLRDLVGSEYNIDSLVNEARKILKSME